MLLLDGALELLLHGELREKDGSLTSVRGVKGKGHLEDVGADEGGDGLGGLEVLAGDDGEVGDDGLGVEGELPERGPVLAEQLVDQRLLGGACAAIGGGGGVRSGVPRRRLREARLLGAGVGARGGSAGGGGGLHGDRGGAHDRRVGGREARVCGAWERERAGELGFARRVA